GERNLMRTFDGFYADGAWRRSRGDRIEVSSPATGEVLGYVSEATSEEVGEAVGAARAAVNGDWGSYSPADRAAALGRLADAFQARKDDFAELFSAEVGTPRRASSFTHV